MYPFIETIRIEEGRICNIDYHAERLNSTRTVFWPQADSIDLRQFIFSLQPLPGVQKCRVLYREKIEEVVCAPYQMRKISSLRLVVSDELDYTYKSAEREELNALFANKEDADDVLIVKNGCLTDTTIANVALYNGSVWHTPAHPLLRGTKRAELLDKQLIIEKDIPVKQLGDYSHIMLFNAMIDWGKIRLPIDALSILDMLL